MFVFGIGTFLIILRFNEYFWLRKVGSYPTVVLRW